MHKLIILLLTTHFCFFAQAKEELLIVTEEWPPFNYQQDDKVSGFSTEIVHLIMNRVGEHSIKLLPSMRSSRVLNTRPYTMMYSMFRTPEREAQYQWIGPLVEGRIFFYQRATDFREFKSIDDLKSVDKLATRHKGLIPSLLLDMGFKNLDKTATKSLQVYQKLLLGRVDVGISDVDLGVSYNLGFLNEDMSAVKKIPIEIFRSDLYIAASLDIPKQEIERWQKALQKLKDEGTYQKILDKYLLARGANTNQ